MNDSINWWQSAQIRAALVMIAPLLIQTIRLSGIDGKLGFNLDEFDLERAIDWAMAAIGALGGTFWIVKRVRAARRPELEPIKPPAVVVAVRRLTRP